MQRRSSERLLGGEGGSEEVRSRSQVAGPWRDRGLEARYFGKRDLSSERVVRSQSLHEVLTFNFHCSSGLFISSRICVAPEEMGGMMEERGKRREKKR